MDKKIRMGIKVLIISFGIWNVVRGANANNYLIKDELLGVKKQISEYKKWVKVNAKPYRVGFTIDVSDNWDVSPIIGDDSKTIPQAKKTELKQKAKPADPRVYGDVYVNDVASTIFSESNFFLSTIVGSKQNVVFPVGSIIVREKLIKRGLMDVFTVSSLAVMIKRDSSFSPQSNGWSFFYLNPTSFSITKNNQALCLSCHKFNQDNDFVFRSYLPKE